MRTLYTAVMGFVLVSGAFGCAPQYKATHCACIEQKCGCPHCPHKHGKCCAAGDKADVAADAKQSCSSCSGSTCGAKK